MTEQRGTERRAKEREDENAEETGRAKKALIKGPRGRKPSQKYPIHPSHALLGFDAVLDQRAMNQGGRSFAYSGDRPQNSTDFTPLAPTNGTPPITARPSGPSVEHRSPRDVFFSSQISLFAAARPPRQPGRQTEQSG